MITLPSFKESFAALVAAPTVSSIDPRHDQGNLPAVELLANWFADLGFGIETMPVGGRPDKVNLVACLGSGGGGLVLSGHTDTVPYNESAWHQDPFRLTEKDGRYYGLGASDMKCFFPIVMQVLQSLDLKKIKRPVILLATCDEECTMAGAKALADANRGLGRHALIGEPTGLQPVIMHKGVMIETITLRGRAGHASNPALGNNAMEGMHEVMKSLLRWRGSMQDKCELKIDLRLLPGMEISDVRSRLRRTVEQALAGRGLDVEFDEIFPGTPPMETDPHSEIVKVAENLSGHDAGTVNFGTEGPYLNSLGMDTVVLGPGDIDQAHQANEYIEQDRIQPMHDLLEKMIAHFCIS